MLIQTKDLFNKTGKQVPLINEPIVVSAGGKTFTLKKGTSKQLMDWIKRTPEAIGMLKTIITDIVTRISFKAVPVQGQGRPSKKQEISKESKAKNFSDMNLFRNKLESVMFDWLLGDGYLWIGAVDAEQLKELVKKKYFEAGLEFKDTKYYKDFLDEEAEVNTIKYIPMTTMDIEYDENKVISYKQRVGNIKKIWGPKEIIHAKFMDIDGKVLGFSPAQSAIPVIITLGMIKDYAGKFFEGGGVPDTIFNFPDEMANSDAIKKMEFLLKEYRNNKKRGHMVIGAKLELHKINEFNKDMEFRELAIYYTGILAFAYGLPLSKINTILGTDVKEGAAGTDLSQTSYQNNIRNSQEYWESLLNTQLWVPAFGVKMTFSRAFLIDEVKETLNRINISDYVFKYNQVLRADYDLQLTQKKVLELFDLTLEDTEKAKMTELNKLFGNRQGQGDKMERERGSASMALSKVREDQANQAAERKPDRASGV